MSKINAEEVDTHTLEIVLRYTMNSTLEEAQEKINDTFESFDDGEYMVLGWTPVHTEIDPMGV